MRIYQHSSDPIRVWVFPGPVNRASGDFCTWPELKYIEPSILVEGSLKSRQFKRMDDPDLQTDEGL